VGFGEGGELEGTAGQPLDLNTTRSGIPTDIYRSVSIPNRSHFTVSVDKVVTFVVTLNKGYSAALYSKELWNSVFTIICLQKLIKILK
jgi:hypothetical protein